MKASNGIEFTTGDPVLVIDPLSPYNGFVAKVVTLEIGFLGWPDEARVLIESDGTQTTIAADKLLAL